MGLTIKFKGLTSKLMVIIWDYIGDNGDYYGSNFNLGVSIVMGVPQARWLVYFVENPNLKWMMTGGTPI